jgi:hypothetical protein
VKNRSVYYQMALSWEKLWRADKLKILFRGISPVLGRSDTTSASDHPLSSFTALQSFRLWEEPVYWLSQHPSFSFLKEFEVLIRRHNLAGSSVELPLLS